MSAIIAFAVPSLAGFAAVVTSAFPANLAVAFENF